MVNEVNFINMQIRRFKITLVFISIFLLLLYGEISHLLSWVVVKKKKRNFYMRIIWYASLITFIFALFKDVIIKKFSKPLAIDKD